MPYAVYVPCATRTSHTHYMGKMVLHKSADSIMLCLCVLCAMLGIGIGIGDDKATVLHGLTSDHLHSTMEGLMRSLHWCQRIDTQLACDKANRKIIALIYFCRIPWTSAHNWPTARRKNKSNDNKKRKKEKWMDAMDSLRHWFQIGFDSFERNASYQNEKQKSISTWMARVQKCARACGALTVLGVWSATFRLQLRRFDMISWYEN